MEASLVAKYGNPKAARYFVKSVEDLMDVLETVYKQLTQQAQSGDLASLMLEIECFAMPIPRTLSSHIIGFLIPEHILDSENRAQGMPIKLADPKPAPNALPKILHNANRTLIVKEIRCFFDIIVFQRFFKNLLAQNSDGLKLFTTKRVAEIRTESLAGSDGFQLTICFPGILFKGQDAPVGS